MSLWSVLTGGGMQSIENIAKEWIETSKEKAEAQTLMLKTLDPNGIMRRNISRRVGVLYSSYFFLMIALLTLEFFGFETNTPGNINLATEKLTSLFLPVTTLYGAIVTASFGVNYSNVKAESAAQAEKLKQNKTQ